MKRLAISLILMLTVLSHTFAQQPIRIWITDSIPVDVLEAVNPLFDSGEYVWTTNLADADLALDFERPGGGVVTTQWVYVPVVSFASTSEIIGWQDIQRYWHGEVEALSYLTPDATIPTFIATNETLRAMASLIGPPAANVPITYTETADTIRIGLWQNRPYTWSIVGFTDLTSDLKVLQLDNFNVFGDDFLMVVYPLTAQIHLKGDPEKLAQAIEDLLTLGTWQPTNRDSNKLARVALSGVTALTRATAAKMEEIGVTKPAEGIMNFVGDAHILHTSNEVSFSQNCPAPNPNDGVVFCSAEKYIDLLTTIGLDVVELTGNHVNDYGAGALRFTLDIYANKGIGTFGGGYDANDARDAYITVVNGNSIAFIGCNVPGPPGAFAGIDRAGAAQCDDAYLGTEIPRLAAEYDIVIMSVQDYEYYTYTVNGVQLSRFRRYASLGADVVIGTQAHQPHGFTFYEGAFLHHGLGNLFFDQMSNLGTRQDFIDKLIVYDGKLINVVLFTGLIENFCCPRPMNPTERTDFLNTIFQASGW